MKIYTKTGDRGETGLFGGERVQKHDARVEAYGNVDETNAALGLARAALLTPELDAVLERVQGQLFVLGAELATPESHRARLSMPLIGDTEVSDLESDIDRFEAELPPLRTFVLPAGSPGASALHHARTVCRRAERSVVAIKEQAMVRDPLIIYLNRLSDLLFVLARHANQSAGIPDVAWLPRASKATPQP